MPNLRLEGATDRGMAVTRTPRRNWIEAGLRALAAGGPDAVRVEALAQALGVTVVTEGIETEDVLAELRALRCEFGQGYLFAHPVAAGEIDDLLAADPRW